MLRELYYRDVYFCTLPTLTCAMNIIFPDNNSRSIDPVPRTVEQVLMEFSINPIEVIVSVNGRLVPEDAIVYENDEIRIIRVAHGG